MITPKKPLPKIVFLVIAVLCLLYELSPWNWADNIIPVLGFADDAGAVGVMIWAIREYRRHSVTLTAVQVPELPAASVRDEK